jgi:hypothetical protein
VLADSLSGLALNLQGARLMLLRDGAGEDLLAQIERAQRVAADGLVEPSPRCATTRYRWNGRSPTCSRATASTPEPPRN